MEQDQDGEEILDIRIFGSLSGCTTVNSVVIEKNKTKEIRKYQTGKEWREWQRKNQEGKVREKGLNPDGKGGEVNG